MSPLTVKDLDNYQASRSYSGLTDEANAALRSVLISLKAYYDSPNPVLDFETLKFKVIDFNGASYLKKLRKKAIINHYIGLCYEDPDWFDEFPTIIIEDIGDIFNYQYCFPWEAIDDNDYLISKTPVNTVEEAIREFTEQTDLILDQITSVKPLSEYEVLLGLSGSKAISGNKKSFHYLEKSKNLKFSEKRRSGSRVFITTGPADGRDAIINKVEDLNTIQYIEYQLDQILHDNDVFKHHLVDKDEDRFLKRYEEFMFKNDFYLMRDIKKEGLTKPKYLLKIVLSALHKKFPQCKAFKNFEFYDGPWFDGDVGQRGHGLGMANNLTTLIQIICFRVLEQRLANDGYDIPLDMICHNDDIIIGLVGSVDQRDDVLNEDIEVLENLGIMISRDKSFSSSFGGIICERYFDRKIALHKKKSYVRREYLMMFTSINVTHLKSNLSSFYYKFRDEINIQDLVAKYGYEFSPKEFNLPISVGGWQRLKSYRVSFDLIELERYYSPEVYRIWEASRLNRIKMNKRKIQKFSPPILNLFDIKDGDIPPDMFEHFFILHDRTISEMFYRFKFDPISRKKCWIKLYNLRKDIFKNTNLKSLPFDNVVQIMLSDGKNYYPTESMIDRYADIEIHKGCMDDPYIHFNPIGCALKKLKLVQDENLTPAFYPLKCRSYENIARADTRKSMGLVINYVPPVFIFKEDETVIPKEDQDFIDFFKSYPAPLLLGKVCQMYGKVPILKSKFFIEKDTFDSPLSKDEFLLLNSVPVFLRDSAIFVRRKFNFSKNEVIDLVDQVLIKFRPPPKQEYVKDSDEDEIEPIELSSYKELNLGLTEEEPQEDLWQKSWDILLDIQDRHIIGAWDPVIYDLPDPAMTPIAEEMKEIFQLKRLNEGLTGAYKDELIAKVDDFRSKFEGFYDTFLKEYFEHEEKSDEESIDFMGDFDLEEDTEPFEF